MKFKKNLLYSLLSHLTILAIVYLGLRARAPEMPKILVRGKNYEVSLANPPAGREVPKSRSGKSSGKKLPSLKDLGIRPSGPMASRPEKRGGEGEDGFSIADSIGTGEESGVYPFFEALWRRINAHVGYPEDFVQERIHGIVNVQLPLNRQGVFKGTWMRLNSTSPMLQAYVVACLLQALREELPKNIWASRDDLILVAQFDFRTFGPGESPRSQTDRHDRNLLYFLRDAYVDPKLNQEIEKLAIRYLPPIIPIPGGFYVDFVLLYKKIEALGKPDPDDLRQIRLQLDRDKWDRMVKKSEI